MRDSAAVIEMLWSGVCVIGYDLDAPDDRAFAGRPLVAVDATGNLAVHLRGVRRQPARLESDVRRALAEVRTFHPDLPALTGRILEAAGIGR